MNQTNHASTVYSIVVGIDYAELGELALAQAVELANRHDRSHIHVVHVLPTYGRLEPGAPSPTAVSSTADPLGSKVIEREMLPRMQTYVENTVKAIQAGANAATLQLDKLGWTLHFRQGDPAPTIAQLAADIPADLIIVGTHGRKGISRFLLGSVAEKVVQLASCSVLVVRPLGAVADADGPKIEPPCPDCLETRRASSGKEIWCERHRQHHAPAHTYHFAPFRDSHQSGLL